MSLVVACFFGLLSKNYPSISLKSEVSVGEIADLLLVIFVAIFVPFYLERKIFSKRSEKDILINTLNNLEERISTLMDGVQDAYLKDKKLKKNHANLMVLEVRRISKHLSLFIEDANNYINKREIHKLIEDIKENQSDFFMLFTLNLKDKNPTITSDTYRQSEKLIFEYIGNISKLRIFINNC